ncbi:hypothetical protein NL676_012471 [Syzygium grande]|nr:hypothetical protein NL676_012471 [Syzygium grande]
MKQEVQSARAAIEYDKKESTENYEHGKLMEQNLISTARELEKLRAEIANAEKRARAAAAVGHNAANNNPEVSYAGNPYPAGYGVNPLSQAQEELKHLKEQLASAEAAKKVAQEKLENKTKKKFVADSVDIPEKRHAKEAQESNKTKSNPLNDVPDDNQQETGVFEVPFKEAAFGP